MNEAYKTYDILFNVPPFTGNEFKYMQEAVDNQKICGDGPFTKKCDEWMEKRFGAKKAMLTTSGSSALDMAALLCGIEPGDEVDERTWSGNIFPSNIQGTPVINCCPVYRYSNCNSRCMIKYQNFHR